MALTLPPLPAFPDAGNEGEKAAWMELADLHMRNEALRLNELRWAASQSGTGAQLPSPLTQITADLIVARLQWDRSVSQEDVNWGKGVAQMILTSTVT